MDGVSHKFNKLFSHWRWRVFLLIGLMACEPESLEISGVPGFKHEMVVSTRMLPNHSVIIWLTKTFGSLDANEKSDPADLISQIVLNDAEVIIEGPSGENSLALYGKGIYGGNITLIPGETYQLHVESESMGSLTAEAQVKPTIEFDELEASIRINAFGDTLVGIDYSFSDPAAKNFYMINVQKFKLSEYFKNELNPKLETFLLEDTTNEGYLYNDEVEFETDEYEPGDTIVVMLSNIDEMEYRFRKLQSSSYSDFIEFISEPANYPSNISGGRGLFFLSVPEVKVLKLEMKE